jgi:hypothetical protein
MPPMPIRVIRMQDTGCRIQDANPVRGFGSVFGARYPALGHGGMRGEGDTTFPHPSSRPRAENRGPDTESGTRDLEPGTRHLSSKNAYTEYASCILHHASCIFLYSKKCSGTAETRGSARVPHPRPMRTGLAPHPRFGPTSIFLNSRRGIQKIERLGARCSVLGVGPAPVPGPRCQVPGSGYR